jgi:acetoin utilization protein AcuC
MVAAACRAGPAHLFRAPAFERLDASPLHGTAPESGRRLARAGGRYVTVPRSRVVWSDRFLDYDFGPHHPFSEVSRGLAARLLDLATRDSAPDRIEWSRSVPVAGRATLELFHRPEYLDFVENAGELAKQVLLDTGDTPSFPGCYEASARLVEGAVQAFDYTVELRRPAYHPAGGLHHAHTNRASGFCIFNDAAVAIAHGVKRGLRIAYIDIDAHHGDGVMYGFYDSGKVLDIDFHQDGRTIFPGTGFPHEVGRGDGAGLKANLPLPPGAGDEALVPLFRRVVPPLVRSFLPDVIVLQHGVDGHYGDEIAHLQFSPAGYAEVDRVVLALAHELTHDRLLVTGGGGYRAESVGRVLARTGLLLAGLDLPDDAAVLPQEWRKEFHRAFGREAPATWGEVPDLDPSPWIPDDESKLVRTLESQLGARFPAP